MLEAPDRSARVRVATSAPVNHFSSSAWISDTSESETNTSEESIATTFLPPANEVCEGYVFTGVCLSTGEGRAVM